MSVPGSSFRYGSALMTARQPKRRSTQCARNCWPIPSLRRTHSPWTKCQRPFSERLQYLGRYRLRAKAHGAIGRAFAVIVGAAGEQDAQVLGDAHVVAATPAAGDPLPGFDRIEPFFDQRPKVLGGEKRLTALDL